jgi:hypothetical protein
MIFKFFVFQGQRYLGDNTLLTPSTCILLLKTLDTFNLKINLAKGINYKIEYHLFLYVKSLGFRILLRTQIHGLIPSL